MAGNATLAAHKVAEELHKVAEELFVPDRGKPGLAMPGLAMPDHETTPAREAIQVGESPLRIPLPRGSPPRRHQRALNKRRPILDRGQHSRVAIPILTTVKQCPEPAGCRRRATGATAAARSPVATAAA